MSSYYMPLALCIPVLSYSWSATQQQDIHNTCLQFTNTYLQAQLACTQRTDTATADTKLGMLSAA